MIVILSACGQNRQEKLVFGILDRNLYAHVKHTNIECCPEAVLLIACNNASQWPEALV